MTRRTHARFTDFRIDWRSVCRGIDDSCWTVCGGIDGSCWTVCAGIGGSRGGVLCAINCFGAPLVGARCFLGFRPLLFGMEREPTVPAGSTLFTFQDIAEYAGPLGGSRPRHHGTGLRSADPAEDTFVAIRQSPPDCAAILITIHGSVSRKTSIRRTFGAHTPIQRCQLHKARNLWSGCPTPLEAAISR